MAKTPREKGMTDSRAPIVFPSRNPYDMSPAVTDRQLWAIGMLVVQWSMTEMAIEEHIRFHIAGDAALAEESKTIRRAQSRIDFWERLVEMRMLEPDKTQALAQIGRVRNLNALRDEVVHRPWGGGMQDGSWGAAGLETADAALLHKRGDKIAPKPSDGRAMVSWMLTYGRLREIARDMATLNRDLMMALPGP